MQQVPMSSLPQPTFHYNVTVTTITFRFRHQQQSLRPFVSSEFLLLMSGLQHDCGYDEIAVRGVL